MENIFDGLDDNDELSLITAQVGLDAVDKVIEYYTDLLKQAVFILCEQMDMEFDQVIDYLEEKADMVGVLDRTLAQLQAVVEVSEDY
jgi:methylase of polypeptide subunit release factors